MFHESEYDTLTFPIPTNGMNQFISPDLLPSNFCFSLENIIPFPVGSGHVRYGTTLLKSLANPESFIIRAFPFTTQSSKKQAILYVNELTQDNTISEKTYINNTCFSFKSDNLSNYQENTYIKINYSLNAVSYALYSKINQVSIAGEVITITLSDNYFPDGVITLQQVWNSSGSIYCYDITDKNLTNRLKAGLSVACVPRSVDFQQVLLICNGVDKCLYWNGAELKEVVDFVKEVRASGFNRVEVKAFTFNVDDTFDETKYNEDNLIELFVNGVKTRLTISSFIKTDETVLITTVETIPNFTAKDRVEVYYRDWPPAFSFMTVANDRIWALGPGAVSLNFRPSDQAMRVYYAYNPNSISSWFNEESKTVPSIDMSDKADIADNFEAISQINGLMVFMGRKKTQIWQGSTPGTEGDFSWSSTVNVGIVNGDLLIELPNDVYFVSNAGIQTLSTLNIARQVAATPRNAVDTVLADFIKQANLSDFNYRACRSFKYEGENIAGFKISNNKILASLFTTELYSWFFLTGDFQNSNAFLDFGNKLILCIGNKIYQYADGADGSPKGYADQGGKSVIPFSWVVGLITMEQKGGNSYANRFYEVVADYPSSFTLNDKNSVEIFIYGDTPTNFRFRDKCSFPGKGDLLNTEPLSQDTTGNDNLPGFRLNRDYTIFIKRFKFASSRFWLMVSGYVMNGPLSLKRVRLFGIGERHG